MPAASRLGHPTSPDDRLLYRISRLPATAEGLRSSQPAEPAQLDRARTSKAITSLVGKKLLRRDTRPSPSVTG